MAIDKKQSIITKVNIKLIKPQNGMIAFADIILNDVMFLSGIAIHKKINSAEYRLTYPNKGKFGLFYPICSTFANDIQYRIFKELEEVIKGKQHDRHDVFANNGR